MNEKRIELEKNKKYGQLTALEPTKERYNNEVIWKFKCDCGEIVYRSLCHVKRNTKLGYVCSCGKHTSDHKSRSSSDNAKGITKNGGNVGILKKNDPYSKNKLGIKGVHYDKERKKYVAQITYKKKYYSLGRYNTADEAKRAYDKKRAELLKKDELNT